MTKAVQQPFKVEQLATNITK
jgi:hypothetical protein